MKTIQTFAGLALAASLAAGCSDKADMPGSQYPADNVVRVTASVDEVRSRSYTSETLENFYLSISNPSSDMYSYGCIPYHKENGEWTISSTAGIVLWQNDSQPVDIVACNRLTDGLGNDPKILYELTDGKAQVNTSQSNDTDFTESDFLTYKRTGFVPKDDLTDGKLAIAFQHGFCLLNIGITLGTDFNLPDLPTESPVDRVTVKDIAYQATVDFTQTPVQITTVEGEKSDIDSHHDRFDKAADKESHAVDHYSCILIPQTVKAGLLKVELSVNAAQIYVWTSTADVTLESGKKYRLNLTIGRDATVAGEITSTAWSEATGGELETE